MPTDCVQWRQLINEFFLAPETPGAWEAAEENELYSDVSSFNTSNSEGPKLSDNVTIVLILVLSNDLNI